MLKEKYRKLQEKFLREAPLRPYELTAGGLALLRRNIIVSFASLFATAALISVMVLIFKDHFEVLNQIEPIFRFGIVILTLISISLLCRVLDKSTGYMLETGLWWRISVSDDLQDEWERGQKHRSGAKSFEWMTMIMAGAFVLWFIGSLISYFALGRFPSMPPFYVTAPLMLTVIYGLSLLPLIHAAWTLKPIVDDEASLEDMKPHVVTSKESKAEDRAPKSWGKRILDVSPYVVGGFFGVWLVSREKAGPFYDVGYDIGRWFGKLFS